jgi:hypothetical protein
MARFSWRTFLRGAFEPAVAPQRAALRDIRKFGIGFCPGCRRLRGAASPSCRDCGSTAPVIEDA